MKATPSYIPLLCLALGACGGSGGDGGGSPPPPSARFAITPSNAAAATGASWQAANSSAGFADLAGTSGVVTTKPGALAKPEGLPSTRALGYLLQKIPFGPDTLPCQVSGSITLSGDLADPTTLTPGDFINADADNCDDGLGEVVNGLMEMSIDAFSGDFFAGLYELTMALELTDFQVTTAADVQNSNGDVTVTLNTLVAPYVTAAVGGSAMTVDGNTESASLQNYESSQSVDGGLQAAPYTLSALGTLDSSKLPGAVAYSTPVPFEGEGSDYPHTGELFVSGEDSSARLVAIDNVNVRIDIDLDDDGSVDESIETTWVALSE
jgi:hypothetical protein